MSSPDVIDPALNDGAVGDVGAQEQQVVDRKVAGEVDYFVEVSGFHHADDGVVAVAQFQLHRIGAIGFYLFGHLEPPRVPRTELPCAGAVDEIARKTIVSLARSVIL